MTAHKRPFADLPKPTQAGILCNDPQFQRFAAETVLGKVHNSHQPPPQSFSAVNATSKAAANWSQTPLPRRD